MGPDAAIPVSVDGVELVSDRATHLRPQSIWQDPHALHAVQEAIVVRIELLEGPEQLDQIRERLLRATTLSPRILGLVRQRRDDRLYRRIVVFLHVEVLLERVERVDLETR
jgi:hypothetical protein